MTLDEAMQKAVEAGAKAAFDFEFGGEGPLSEFSTTSPYWKDSAKAALTAALSTLEEAGWVVVPADPTDQMMVLGDIRWIDDYRAMLEARPRTQQRGEG
jgi:hypothetical protein